MLLGAVAGRGGFSREAVEPEPSRRPPKRLRPDATLQNVINETEVVAVSKAEKPATTRQQPQRRGADNRDKASHQKRSTAKKVSCFLGSLGFCKNSSLAPTLLPHTVSGHPSLANQVPASIHTNMRSTEYSFRYSSIHYSRFLKSTSREAKFRAFLS